MVRKGILIAWGRPAKRKIAQDQSFWPYTGHHLPGEEQPEYCWVYRFLKKQLFFGMGGYG